MLEETGERLLPDRQWGELVHAEHLARYRLAAQFAPGRRVLDAASGEGYGSALLAAAGAAEVVGVDLSAEAVRHASERYGLSFLEGDVAALPLPDDSFDLVVSFETIEHVADPERALAELRRVLAPSGLALVSTPNAAESLVENPFHLRELAHDEFVAALRAHFDPVRFLFQQNWLLSAVLEEPALRADDAAAPLDVELVKAAGIEPGGELYTLALCGEAPSPRQVAVATGVYEAHRMATELRDATAAVQKWRERAQEAERQRFADSVRAQQVIDAMQRSVSWRVTRPMRAAAGRLRRSR